jgi:hypothetical protein
MQEVLQSIDLSSGPTLAALTLAILVTLIVGRVVSNQLHGNRPPVLEGIPFIGGLQKFIKVWLKKGHSWQRHC